ncbi:MAG TPA: SDR family oxidoreductase [Pyrinomonadaceae bacterium]|nr:SDR family oxidoreductase [Pyrinomonadaceae bacterium]
MNRLENKTAVITGGGGSIGKTTAKLFLAEGAKVVLVDLKDDALQKAAKELGGGEKVLTCAADVTKSEEVKNYVAKTVEAFGKIDVFFNNAGIEGIVKPIAEYPEEKFDQVMAVNVRGVWLGCKYVLPEMNDGGSIIITSSVSGLIASPDLSAYITSKHAVVGIMRAVALEAAPRGIRVNTVHPSPVDNRMMRSLEEGFSPGQADEAKRNLEKLIPLGRYAKPEEISKLVLFLGSDDSQFITGTKHVIDGGQTVT